MIFNQHILFSLIITITLTLSLPVFALDLHAGWQATPIAQWGDKRPDMLVLSHDENTLFLSFEVGDQAVPPSLGRIDLVSKTQFIILTGLVRADGLKIDAAGNLWLGEEMTSGMVWKINPTTQAAQPQNIDRQQPFTPNPMAQAIHNAGVFSHEGLAFSQDGAYLYLLDEWKYGCLYRYDITHATLSVFHIEQGWLAIADPVLARQQAHALHASIFSRGEDMETMPDGSILFAETDTGQIWKLNDSGKRPGIMPFLKHRDIAHPDNLEWDATRKWLWISDDDHPSELWAWDGKTLHRIASSMDGEITGIETASDGRVFINLQGSIFGSDQTMVLTSKP